MSYDLMVFDPNVAPQERSAFMAWYRNLTKWHTGRDYSSPVGMTGNLRAFYDTLRTEFPPMNGPDAQKTDIQATDYTLAENAIYMAFPSSDDAYNRVFNVALSTGVGFFDVSADNGDILHDTDQFYELMGL